MTEVYQNMRRGVIQTLRLISSKEEQLEFQRNVPICKVVLELFFAWDSAYSTDPDWDEYLIPTYSDEERAAMAKFHAVFLEVDAAVPKITPQLDDFIKTPEWARLNAAAQEALKAFPPAEVASV